MCVNPTLRAWADPSRTDLTVMMGVACGDTAGSIYELRNIRYRLDDAHLIAEGAHYTDDTVLSCAVARGLHAGLAHLPQDWMAAPEAEQVLTDAVRLELRRFGQRFPAAGYGSKFCDWMMSDDPQPYGSWGNGSAMRVSYAGWVARTLEEAEKLGEISAAVTHNHPEGVKGAAVVAGCIFLLRQTGDKEAVRAYAGRHYDLNFTLNEIRDTYTFNASCQGSVPQAIVAFLEAADFTDAISGAISIGGDSDTIAAIAASLAEVIYPIPAEMLEEVTGRMDDPLLAAIAGAVEFARNRA
ncbi:MAG: ADP-ribosylglycohydrolase family protein [Clostridia bacterium]|nr:ADP-ribosylglycohydrolase family protein [Clostridia bacterium]